MDFPHCHAPVSLAEKDQSRVVHARWGALTSTLLLLGAAYIAILLTGAKEQGSLGLFLAIAGAVLILFKPQDQLSWRVWTLGGAFLGTAAFSLLPLGWSSPPEWRQRWQAAEEIPVGDTITPIPLETVWWWSLLMISVGVAFFVLTRPLRSREQLVLANTAISLTALYAALAIFCELSGWRFPFDVQPTFGFFRNRNHTASFLVVGAMLSLGVLGLSAKRGHCGSRWLAGAALLLCSSALFFFSISRAGIVFLGLGAILWLLGVGRTHLTQANFLSISGLLLAGLLVFIVSDGAARQRVLGLAGLEEGVRADAMAMQEGKPFDFRLLIFQDTWRMIQDAPWTGMGLGTFAAVFPQYQQASLQTATAAHPESDWLMLAAEAGLPCVALLAVLIAVMCWPLRHFRDHPYWPLRWGMICAGFTAASHGLVDVPAHRIPLGWWILLISVASLRHAPSMLRPHWAQRGIFLVIGGTALLLGGGLIHAEWFHGSPSAPFAGADTQQIVAEHAAANRLEEGIDTAEAGIDRTPLSDGLYYQMGCLLLQEGDAPEYVDDIFAAQRLLQPRWPEIPFRQGLAWLGHDPIRALALWKGALARQLAIDAQTREQGATAFYHRLLREAQNDTQVRDGLLDPSGKREFVWIWLETVPRELLEPGLQRLAQDALFLQSLQPGERQRFIQLWAKRGSLPPLQEFVEKTADWKEIVWLLHLREALDRQAFEQAVNLVCKQFEISLQLPDQSDGPPPPGASAALPAVKFVHLWARGKEVTARAVLTEAEQTGRVPADVYRWQAALTAHDGKWPAAWKHLQNYLRATHRHVW